MPYLLFKLRHGLSGSRNLLDEWQSNLTRGVNLRFAAQILAAEDRNLQLVARAEDIFGLS